MKVDIQEKDIKLIDHVIKINVAATGNFAEAQNLMSRCIWNICFNPREYKRSKQILKDITKSSKFRHLPECQGSLPK